MKFSDAVMLGSTRLALNSDLWHVPGHCGCLVGFALEAMGKVGDNRDAVREYRELWPWLSTNVEIPVFIRKNSIRWPMLFTEKTEAAFIVSAWAVLVSTGAATLEQAVDWIRSVEPEEPKTEAEAEAPNVHLRDMQEVKSV